MSKKESGIVKFELLNGEVEIIKRALEIYAHSLDFLMEDEHLATEDRQRKITMLRCTYETILSFQAKQINGVSTNTETLNKFGKGILNSENLIEFIPNEGNLKVM